MYVARTSLVNSQLMGIFEEVEYACNLSKESTRRIDESAHPSPCGFGVEVNSPIALLSKPNIRPLPDFDHASTNIQPMHTTVKKAGREICVGVKTEFFSRNELQYVALNTCLNY